MIKKLAVCVIVLAVALAFMPMNTFASSKTVSMTAFNQVIKSGNTLYCAGAEGIYKVEAYFGDSSSTLITKKLHKMESMGAYSYYSGMKKKGDYLYCQVETEGTTFLLVRINCSTGKQKILASASDKGAIRYVIKGKKIYYKPKYGKKKVMKLNGKSKRKTSIAPKMTRKKSNADGYSISITSEKEGEYAEHVYTYLNTPYGQYKLGDHVIE